MRHIHEYMVIEYVNAGTNIHNFKFMIRQRNFFFNPNFEVYIVRRQDTSSLTYTTRMRVGPAHQRHQVVNESTTIMDKGWEDKRVNHPTTTCTTSLLLPLSSSSSSPRAATAAAVTTHHPLLSSCFYAQVYFYLSTV